MNRDPPKAMNLTPMRTKSPFMEEKQLKVDMPEIHPEESFFQIPGGNVRIRSFCSPEEIRKFTLNQEFRAYAAYKSLYTDRESLENDARQPDANVVLALADGNQIIGFGVLNYPRPEERWADLGSGLMIELKAIEVSRSWRSTRVASAILGMLMVHPLIEEKIVYLVGYSWTWDLEGTGKTVAQYRRLLIDLFGQQGFQEYRTNEANICLRPENIFMCRVGKEITGAILNRFKWLRFGLSPWTWNVD
jgi:acetoin utilization protein AcuA